MAVTQYVRALVIGSQHTETVRECRHCGTSVSPGADVCPCCDRDEVVDLNVT